MINKQSKKEVNFWQEPGLVTLVMVLTAGFWFDLFHQSETGLLWLFSTLIGFGGLAMGVWCGYYISMWGRKTESFNTAAQCAGTEKSAS